MVECPRCGSNINAIKQECFKCGYLHDWDDFVDYELIEVNSFDKILEYNSYEIIDVVRERNQLIPKVSNQIRFCPECGSFIVQKEPHISCLVCGYDGYFVMDSASLWQDIIEVMCDCPLDFVEKHKLDDFWVIQGRERYHSRRYYDKALLCYDKAIELNELNGDAWIEKASIYDAFYDYSHRDECYKNALKCYNQILKIDPSDDYTLNKKGEYFLKRNNLKRALKCFSEAIKYDSNNYVYWNNKGDCYKLLNEYDLALKCYDKSLSINKFLCDTLFSKAQIFRKLEEYSLMLECYDKIIEFEDYPVNVWNEKADYYSMKGNIKKAMCYFDKVLEYYSNSLDEYALEEYGNLYYEMGEYPRALLYFEKITDIDKDNDYAWFQKAMIYDELEDYGHMLECYERVLKINPNEYVAWFNMGIYYENNRFYRNAIKCYDNSLKIFQDDEDAWLNEANCYLELKNSYMVKFCYKKVLEINPLNEYAKDMLNNI